LVLPWSDTAVEQHDWLGKGGFHYPATLEHNLCLSTLLSIWNRPGCIPQRETEESQGKQWKVELGNTAPPIPQMWNRKERAFGGGHFFADCSTICGIARSRFQQIHAIRAQSVPDPGSARYQPQLRRWSTTGHGRTIKTIPIICPPRPLPACQKANGIMRVLMSNSWLLSGFGWFRTFVSGC